MRAEGFSLIVFFILLVELVDSVNRSNFPVDFLFGTASSSYQYEGATNEGGRGLSIWDTFTHRHPDRIRDQSSGDLAVDSYHRYKEDVRIMKDIGFDAYRFSISWSRVLPGGNLRGGINREGITYYNNLINELLSNGLQPFVTLFHWDLPQALEDEYGGFLSSSIVKDFADYAELCFREFGDRVKHWITLNEPVTYTTQGYANGLFAPGRCSKRLPFNCSAGDSSTEPYLVTHHQILAHAAAVKVYRDKYKISQKGQIGITLNSPWIIPLSQSKEDINAATRALAFLFDWFMEPLKSGSYPVEMVNNTGERLPKFSREQSLMVKGSFDFIGLNYYTASYAANVPCTSENKIMFTDSCVVFTSTRHGVQLGPKVNAYVGITAEQIQFLKIQFHCPARKQGEKWGWHQIGKRIAAVTFEGKITLSTFIFTGIKIRAASDWLYIYPRGIQDLLVYTKEKFNNPIIYITENGVDEFNDNAKSLEDNMRIEYFSNHLSHVQNAIQNGVNVKGYFVWSLLDNFEWADGYSVRFGIIYIDFKNGLSRYPKKSAEWFKKFLH